MKKTKMEKGITLIALIISIVILLILAVVTIGAVKESSIIGNSKKASSEYTISQEKETLQLALGEWAMQKYNAEENTTTFENFMKSALSDKDVAISSTDGETLKVTFNKTDHSYTVKSDGTITGPDSSGPEEGEASIPTELEKYIFGQDLQGRDFEEIFDLGEKEFKDDTETLANASSEIEWLECVAIEKVLAPNETLRCFYIKYNNEIYKFKYVLNEDDVDNPTTTTEASYGITKLEVDTENTRVGKKVSYDGKTWTILYDDNINGLQMLCDETYKYNGEDFRLGSNDSLITNWETLDNTTEEFKVADMDESGKLDNDLEKTIYSYNNAIKTLNEACKNVVTSNTNISSVRCVGSNPIDMNSETEERYETNNSENFVSGKLKGTDLNYVTDYERMITLEITTTTDDYGSENYWLASRLTGEDGKKVYYLFKHVNEYEGYYSTTNFVLGVNLTTGVYRTHSDRGNLRPVITLNDNVQLQANESGTTDYILN